MGRRMIQRIQAQHEMSKERHDWRSSFDASCIGNRICEVNVAVRQRMCAGSPMLVQPGGYLEESHWELVAARRHGGRCIIRLQHVVHTAICRDWCVARARSDELKVVSSQRRHFKRLAKQCAGVGKARSDASPSLGSARVGGHRVAAKGARRVASESR